MRDLDVLVVCTGNTCRSPMAEALLGRHLAARGAGGARVHSAGTLPWGGPATDGARVAVAERGLALDDHRSRALTTDLVDDADLVLGMTRDHVGRVLALRPGAQPRTFLVGELARLGRHVGPRHPTQPVTEWIAAVAAHRPPGRPPGRAADEIVDPAGEPVEVYRRTADRLDRLTSTIADLLVGTGHDTDRGEAPQP